MASSNYRLCDVCDGKVFHDSNLSYEFEPSEYRDTPPFRIAGAEQNEDPEANHKYGMRLGYLGDWAVLCEDCAKTHKTQIVKIDSDKEQS